MADAQSQKFAEIADLLAPDGRFVVTYVNFDHRRPAHYTPYSNIQSLGRFPDKSGPALRGREADSDGAQLESQRAWTMVRAGPQHVHRREPGEAHSLARCRVYLRVPTATQLMLSFSEVKRAESLGVHDPRSSSTVAIERSSTDCPTRITNRIGSCIIVIRWLAVGLGSHGGTRTMSVSRAKQTVAFLLAPSVAASMVTTRPGAAGDVPSGPPADFRSRAEEVPTRPVSAVPRLSIGLPVYNWEPAPR